MKICVLGAGVVGLTSAWWLAEAGHEIVIVDRHAKPGAEASAANGAQLSYGFVAPLASPAMLRKLPSLLLAGEDAIRVSFDLELMRWGIRFLRACTASAVETTAAAQLALAELSRIELAQLAERQKLEFGLRTAGKLVLYRDTGDFTAAQPAHGGTEQEVLTPDQCLALEPGLRIKASELAGGIYTASEQVGDCAVFCNELFARLRRHERVETRMSTPIDKPVVTRGRLTAVETDRGAIEADLFVLSLGCGSKAFARACGFDLPIYPIKGHSITINDGGGGSLSHNVTDYSRKIVFAPLGDATGTAIRVAGFADFKGYDRTLDASRIATLRQATAATLGEMPGLEQEVSPWAGLRPTTPDSRPIIGASPVDGLVLNTGQGMLGWTLACGSARLLADLVEGKPPPCPTEPFSGHRFW